MVSVPSARSTGGRYVTALTDVCTVRLESEISMVHRTQAGTKLQSYTVYFILFKLSWLTLSLLKAEELLCKSVTPTFPPPSPGILVCLLVSGDICGGNEYPLDQI